jgi:hypothetical protein
LACCIEKNLATLVQDKVEAISFPSKQSGYASLTSGSFCTLKAGRPGTDVIILRIFLPKNSAKKLAFFTQNKAKLCKILIITLVFKKNANFFAENCRKSQKIVIITSTSDLFDKKIRPMAQNVARPKNESD